MTMQNRLSTIAPLSKAHASGYPLQGRRLFAGLRISIENKAGSWRVDKANTPPKWRTKMELDYGYIQGSEGVDGDHIDVYLGPNEGATHAYIVRQVDPRNGRFDEQKVMLGFDSAEAAKAAYLKHYDSPKFFGGIKAMPIETFKRKALASLHGTKLIKSLAGGLGATPGATPGPVLDGDRVAELVKAITADSRRLEKDGGALDVPIGNAGGPVDGLAEVSQEPPADFLAGLDWQQDDVPLVFTEPSMREALAARAYKRALYQSVLGDACGMDAMMETLTGAQRRRAQAALLASIFYGGVIAARNMAAMEAAVDADPATFDRVLAQLRPELAAPHSKPISTGSDA